MEHLELGYVETQVQNSSTLELPVACSVVYPGIPVMVDRSPLPPDTACWITDRLAYSSSSSFPVLWLKSLHFQQLVDSQQEPRPNLGMKPGPRASKKGKIGCENKIIVLSRGLQYVNNVTETNLLFILWSEFMHVYTHTHTRLYIYEVKEV